MIPTHDADMERSEELQQRRLVQEVVIRRNAPVAYCHAAGLKNEEMFENGLVEAGRIMVVLCVVTENDPGKFSDQVSHPSLFTKWRSKCKTKKSC